MGTADQAATSGSDRRSGALTRAPGLCRASVVSLLSMLMGFSPAARAAEPQVVIVFDGSGSMWGKLNGSQQAKFEMAREALASAIGSHGTHARYGLVTFGLQARGGCNAADVAVKPGADGKAALAPLAQFNPKGRGPLTLGLRKAAEALKDARGPQRILIVHDDPDNCHEDVCEAARTLKKNMPGLEIHSVWLGTKSRHAGAMSCLAKLTGGTVAETANADEAIAALNAAIRRTAGAAPVAAPVAPKPRPASKPSAVGQQLEPTPGLALSVVLAPGGAPLADAVRWRITATGGGDTKPSRTVEGARPSIPLQPGEYVVEADIAGRVVRQTFTVAKGVRTRATINLDAGRLRITPVMKAADGKAPGVHVAAVLEIRPTDAPAGSAPVWLGQTGTRGIILRAGRYRAVLQAGTVRRETDLTIAAGEDRAIEVPLDAGRLTLSLGKGAAAGKPAVFAIEADDPTRARGRRIVARSAAHTATFLLAAGTYYVTARSDNGSALTSVVVAAGADVSRKLTLTAMALKVLARLKGRTAPVKAAVEHTVWRLDGSSQPVASSSTADPVFRLPPGRYRIRSQIGEQNSALVQDFEVGTDTAGDLPVEHAAGTVQLSLPESLASGGDIYWRLMDSTGRTLWRADTRVVDLVLKAGTYSVIVDAGRSTFRSQFTVASGQHVARTLGSR